MPFTFSHPIYIAPLKYVSPKYVSLTGLILGSMSPDFEYFLMLEPYRSIGHSLTGLILQAIPLSIIFALLFHHLVKRSIVIHLPSIFNLDRRAYDMIEEWRLRSARDWIVFILSVVLGFISHIAVDSLTHAYGYFVVHISLLSEVVFLDMPIYKLLQYGLSILGLLASFGVILYFLFKSKPHSRNKLPYKETTKQKIMYWLLVTLITVTLTLVKLLFTSSDNTMGIVIVAPISGFFIGLVLVSCVMKGIKRLRKVGL